MFAGRVHFHGVSLPDQRGMDDQFGERRLVSEAVILPEARDRFGAL
jgi:hypothetical protein